ncbi:MAG TPA: hypothetical protein VFY29_16680 [Terriglobia bacterium]|nr:hypothetical protein [Terriglobia bacterium]
MSGVFRRPVLFGFAVVTVACLLFQGTARARAEEIPSTISDAEFWRLITDLSENGGQFPQQYMSNEDSALFVIPGLESAARRNGIYVGVGPEQNFTYIAAIQPRLSFILDIRRDNMIELLMYKALFELSSDRADFLSRLFARKRPPNLDSRAGVQAIFDAFRPIEADADFYARNLQEVTERLAGAHHFPLNDADRTSLATAMNAFRTAGPYSLKGFGDTTNPPYAAMMAATDLAGKQRSYLASEENFRIVQDLQKKNLIVPLVGDFAGAKAIRAVGQYVRDHNAVVDVFYLSNVERYLFEQDDNSRRFYANVAALPLNSNSLFIRSVTSDISRRLNIPIPDQTTKWRTFLSPINEFLAAVNGGKIETYRDVFTIVK